MTEAVFDFQAINRRLNRKPEPVAEMSGSEPAAGKLYILGNPDCSICNPAGWTSRAGFSVAEDEIWAGSGWIAM